MMSAPGSAGVPAGELLLGPDAGGDAGGLRGRARSK